MWDSGDAKRALKLFRESADAGYASAKNSIGFFLDHGLGVRKDSVHAMLWYRRAARKGDLCAYSNIAINYRNAGKKRRARFWFAKAAGRGDGSAAVELAKLLLEMNRKATKGAALRWLRSAVKSKSITEDERAEVADLLESIGA